MRIFTALALLLLTSLSIANGQAPPPPTVQLPDGLTFIDTAFENASPLWYDVAPDGAVRLHLLYDHERQSPNRAAGHFHFQLQGQPGAKFTLEFVNLDNVYNGRPGSVAREIHAVMVSTDGRQWKSVATEVIDNQRVRLAVEMPAEKLFVARVEPYRISDLESLLASIRQNPLVQIETIGRTVEGRELEIVRVGQPTAPYRVFLRARAHPWEPGGNWVVQGLIRRLLKGDEHAKKCLERYCVYVLPMANKDGVARGRTRFNMQGIDLNRNWHIPAPPRLAPENHALEQWLEKMIAENRRPNLALELHNDGSGKLHISRPPVAGVDRYLKRMETLEQLLRQHTWFSEGSTVPSVSSRGTLGSGWLERFGIDAAVHEFNCQWIAKLQEPPLGRHWEDYGENLTTVFYEYFGLEQP